MQIETGLGCTFDWLKMGSEISESVNILRYGRKLHSKKILVLEIRIIINSGMNIHGLCYLNWELLL